VAAGERAGAVRRAPPAAEQRAPSEAPASVQAP
jgi:hypothetical protein